jgi:DNA-binding CsgD family transcriptional regulator
LHRKKDQEEFSHVLTGISRDSAKDPLSEFELLFRQLHPEFYEKLLNRCPQLSKSELHISAMIRLNLSTKDMASLVNLSISTIETNRYHIRKKLSLDQGENLTTCLMQV